MAATEEQRLKHVTRLIIEESDKRLDTYYEAALPGEPDSPITPMGAISMWVIALSAIALIALWLIGRFVILPIYV